MPILYITKPLECAKILLSTIKTQNQLMDTAVKKFTGIQMRVYNWARVVLLPAGNGGKKRQWTSEEVAIELLICR